MKIAYLSTARIPDDWGHVIQIMKMCEAFAQEGHSVELIVPYRRNTRKEDPFTFVGARPVFTITRLPCLDLSSTSDSRFLYLLRTISFLLCARIYLFCKRFDVLYTREHVAAHLLSNFVFEVHSVSSGMRKAFAKALALVVITTHIQTELIEGGIEPKKIMVASDAVDLETFRKTESKTEARTRLGLSGDTPIALYLGRIDAWKGMGALFGAASLLRGVQIVVIGAEPQSVPTLRQQYPAIIFIPFRPYKEVANNQSVADVLLLPNTATNAMASKYTSPLKLFTYMVSGIPIVASDLPATREVLSEANAYLVAPDSPKALAEGIEQALQDRPGSALRASQARKDVERYTWRARAKAILAFI